MIYFSDFEEVAATQFGALGYQAVGGQGITSPAVVTWDSEAYDVTGWHSTSSNTSQFVVPSGVTLVRVTSNVRTDSSASIYAEQLKGGATFVGQGKSAASSTGDDCVNMISAPNDVSASNYFETSADVAGTGATVAANTWMSIEVLDSSTKRALAKKTSNQALTGGVTTTITWDAEEYDTDAFHDNSTNNSRFTVPATGRYRVISNVICGASAGQTVLSMLKNGSGARGLPAKDCDTAVEDFVNAASAVLELASGDYIEVQVFNTNSVNLLTADETWFSIEDVPSSYQCCLVYKSGSQSITSGVNTILSWGAEVYDDAAMHDNSTNNSRITVPAGCTRARPSFGVKTSSTTGQMIAEVFLDGATYTGSPRYECDTPGTDNLSAIGAWVDVTPGQYFEVNFFSSGAPAIGTDNETWFCLECQ